MMNPVLGSVIPQKGDFGCDESHKWCRARLRAVSTTIEPEPTAEEREAIVAALAGPSAADAPWADAALLEGVEDSALDP
jgi:hypothetical protein